MKFLASICLSLLSTQAFGASGFRWLSSIAHSIHLPESLITFVLVCSTVILLGVFYRISLSKTANPVVPDKGITYRNLIEGFGDFIYKLCEQTMGEEKAKTYYSSMAMLFLMIFLSNIIGLIPGFLPPTVDLNVTLALGFFAFIYYNAHGIRVQGLWGHIKHFMGPMWYMAFLIFPIEIISHCVRPISLALRLRGNMNGDHLVLEVFSGLIPVAVPVVFMFLGLFVSFVQAFVFTMLTMVYISLATEVHHDHDHEEAHH